MADSVTVSACCLCGCDDARVDADQLAAAGLRAHLNHAGGFERVHEQESIGHVLRDGDQAVVAQHEEGLRAEVAHQSRLLVFAQGHAFIVVIAKR